MSERTDHNSADAPSKGSGLTASRKNAKSMRAGNSQAQQVDNVPGDSFTDIGVPAADTTMQYRSARFETALMRTSRRIRKVYDAGLQAVGLNLTEVNLLVMVFENGPLSQTQLAERYGIGRARAGAVVDTLESRGLLRRVPDALDRRVWMVEATPLAAELVEKINAIDASIRADLRDGMSRTERMQLARMLHQLEENLAYLEERLAE